MHTKCFVPLYNRRYYDRAKNADTNTCENLLWSNCLLWTRTCHISHFKNINSPHYISLKRYIPPALWWSDNGSFAARSRLHFLVMEPHRILNDITQYCYHLRLIYLQVIRPGNCFHAGRTTIGTFNGLIELIQKFNKTMRVSSKVNAKKLKGTSLGSNPRLSTWKTIGQTRLQRLQWT